MAAAGGKWTFEAVVPKDARPGETFVAASPDGQLVDVAVPEGTAPGDVLRVEYVPVCAAGPPPAMVIGVPVARSADPLGALEEARGYADRADEESWSLGWSMYGLGWCLCCFLGPLGPILWFCTWMMHWLRPRDERARYPRERAVAQLSCWTGLAALAVHVALAVGFLRYWHHTGSACFGMYERQSCMLRPAPGQQVGWQTELFCPPECGPARCYDGLVWGGQNGAYAGDSLICGAALHAGAVKDGVGGLVVLTITPGQLTFRGNTANGVKSHSSGEHYWGFTIARADAADDGWGTRNATGNATRTVDGRNATAATDRPSSPSPKSTTEAPATTSAIGTTSHPNGATSSAPAT